MTSKKPQEFKLSILVPTYERPDLVADLLARLRAQTIDPKEFEVVLVDDGSKTPLEVDASSMPFELRLLRQKNAGPAAARNLGLKHCRAPLTLILNDDAVPANDLCEQHLAAHEVARSKGEEKIAVLGTFTFDEESLQSPFTQMLANSDLLFAFSKLADRHVYDWAFFWTCNLSLSTQALLEIGGFDQERFDRAIVEDVELGYRLSKRGYRVMHWTAARCEHHHALSPEAYDRRSTALGFYLGRMYKKHGDREIMWGWQKGHPRSTYLDQLQNSCELYFVAHRKFVEAATKVEREQWGRQLPLETLKQMATLTQQTMFIRYAQGALREFAGVDPIPVLENGPTPGRLTSILVVTHDAIDQTRRCLAALRANMEKEHPVELIFVDNGSSDGTQEFLEAQEDVRSIFNEENLGAPHARNQALQLAQGEQIVFMDNDVMVTPGWLGRLLFHLEVDGRSGCVSCLSDRAGHHQQITYPQMSSDPETLAEFSTQVSEKNHRKFRGQGLMTSFLLMVRRNVIDVIGGFDERFSPWGFEDDDFSLRARLAGFRNRIALDVFVRHEPYSGTAKMVKHDNLLGRNWKRFAKKWGLPADAAYGDCAGLNRIDHDGWAHADLYMPLDSTAEQREAIPTPTGLLPDGDPSSEGTMPDLARPLETA